MIGVPVLMDGGTGPSFSPPTTAVGTKSYFCIIANTDDAAPGVKTDTVRCMDAAVTVNRRPSGEDITDSFIDANFLAVVRTAVRVPSGPIYESDTLGITNITQRSRNISDLSGIEHFRDLEYLDISSNRITEMDLSNNRMLKTLYVNNNLLTNLDLTNNTLLESVYCFNNELSGLDIAGINSLRILSCYANNMGDDPDISVIGWRKHFAEAGSGNPFRYFRQRPRPVLVRG